MQAAQVFARAGLHLAGTGLLLLLPQQLLHAGRRLEFLLHRGKARDMKVQQFQSIQAVNSSACICIIGNTTVAQIS